MWLLTVLGSQELLFYNPRRGDMLPAAPSLRLVRSSPNVSAISPLSTDTCAGEPPPLTFLSHPGLCLNQIQVKVIDIIFTASMSGFLDRGHFNREQQSGTVVGAFSPSTLEASASL